MKGAEMCRKMMILIIMTMAVGCNSKKGSSTAPPGWRVPVSNLFIEVTALPENWTVDFSTPKDNQDDPTINHVGREWGGPGSGRAWQSIWRAYSISDAEELYKDLRVSQFIPKETLEPDTPFVKFSPPNEINFTSRTADEFYFACGVWRFPYCEVVARYRNYVTNVHLPLKATNVRNGGFTYDQIENVLRGMDQQFTEFFTSTDK
jgi:hypothetical protein